MYLIVIVTTVLCNIGEIHYHKENKTNGGKQIGFSAESNQFEKRNNSFVFNLIEVIFGMKLS